MKLRLEVKIAVHTMALVAVAVVLVGWLHYERASQELIGLHQDSLLHIATTAALSLDAEVHTVLAGQEARDWPAFRKMRRYLLAVKEENHMEMPISTLRKVGQDEAEYVVTTHALARVGTRRPLTQAMRPAFEQGKPTVTGIYTDERGLLMSAYAPIKHPSGEVEAVLAVDYRADELMADLRARKRLTIIYGASVLVVALVLSVLLARTISRPMARLLEATRALAQGDYEHRIEVESRDEVGELAEEFDKMRQSLKEALAARERLTGELTRTVKQLEDNLQKLRLLEKVKAHLEKFVPSPVVKLIEEAPERPALQKQQADVSVLFMDVVGYTRLSEEVDRERMDYIIERYFSNFIDPIQAHGGDINETAGDGLMILFQHPDPAEHARRAVETARAIRDITEAVNAEEAIIRADLEGDFKPLSIRFGINSGQASVGVTRFEGIGGERYTFTATGPVTNIAARIVELAGEGEILLGQETARRIRESFDLEPKGEFRLRNVSQPVEVFRVRV